MKIKRDYSWTFFLLNHREIVSVMKIVSAVCEFIFTHKKMRGKIDHLMIAFSTTISIKKDVCACTWIKIENCDYFVCLKLRLSTKQLFQLKCLFHVYVWMHFRLSWYHDHFSAHYLLFFIDFCESSTGGCQRWMIENVNMEF